MGGQCNTHESGEKFMQNISGKSERYRSLGKPGRRWKYNVTINVIETV
jgi:hypothetical protein